MFAIERFMRLTNEEAFAIPASIGEYSDPNTGKAFEKYPLAPCRIRRTRANIYDGGKKQ